MISLLTLSSSSTLANSPSLEAAARRTMGVSSEHRFRKYLEIRMRVRGWDSRDPEAAGGEAGKSSEGASFALDK